MLAEQLFEGCARDRGATYNPRSSLLDMHQGEERFLGFVLFINEDAKASHLFWVIGTGAGIPEAARQRALDALFERLRRDYIG
jgi:hypothetical protein